MNGPSLTPLYDPADGQLQVVALMSGSGTNVKKLLGLERRIAAQQGRSPYHVAAIFSNVAASKAAEIGRAYAVPVHTLDMNEFYRERGMTKKQDVDWAVRRDFDMETVNLLAPYGAKVAAFGGYMSIAQDPLLEAFITVNVHPGDLRVMDGTARRYTGAKAVAKAILDGAKEIRASTHILTPEVDGGPILMISRPLPVELGLDFDPKNENLVKCVAGENQDRLKIVGDWDIFPSTVLYIARGRYAMDDHGIVHFDGKPVPDGMMVEDIDKVA